MRLRIANRVFEPRVWALLLTAVTLAGFVSLGDWQLRRAREKQDQVASFARGAQTSIALEDDATIDGLPRYQHVTTHGRYDVAHQILVDNMPSQAGRPGYRVLTPLLRPGAARLLLVDRGWVPLGASRETLPTVDVGAEARDVAGRLDQLPQPGVRVGEAGVTGDERWPRVLNFPRQADLEQVLGRPIEARILLLDPAAPDGYERAWRPAMGFGPERHLGYAIQWFALATTVFVVFVALSLHPIAPVPSNPATPDDQTPP